MNEKFDNKTANVCECILERLAYGLRACRALATEAEAEYNAASENYDAAYKAWKGAVSGSNVQHEEWERLSEAKARLEVKRLNHEHAQGARFGYEMAYESVKEFKAKVMPHEAQP